MSKSYKSIFSTKKILQLYFMYIKIKSFKFIIKIIILMIIEEVNYVIQKFKIFFPIKDSEIKIYTNDNLKIFHIEFSRKYIPDFTIDEILFF